MNQGPKGTDESPGGCARRSSFMHNRHTLCITKCMRMRMQLNTIRCGPTCHGANTPRHGFVSIHACTHSIKTPCTQRDPITLNHTQPGGPACRRLLVPPHRRRPRRSSAHAGEASWAAPLAASAPGAQGLARDCGGGRGARRLGLLGRGVGQRPRGGGRGGGAGGGGRGDLAPVCAWGLGAPAADRVWRVGLGCAVANKIVPVLILYIAA
jgi:hypothetical protein